VRWTADQVIRRLLPEGSAEEWRDPSGAVVLAEVSFSPLWVGQRVTRLEHESGSRVALLTRLGEGILPHVDSVVQEGDLVHVCMRADRTEDVAAVFAAGPRGTED
jgi:trk system potassium uptake protein TrkA